MLLKTTVILLSILSAALAVPVPCRKGQQYNKTHCISMTAKREAEIQKLVTKIGNYINDLASIHEDYDIRLSKLDIERHLDNDDEKETKIEVVINDCPPGTKETVETTEKKAVTTEKTSETKPIVKPELIALKLDVTAAEFLKEYERRVGIQDPLIVIRQERNNEIEYAVLK